MKLRSFFSSLAIIVLVLLLIAAGGLVWLTARNPLSLLKGGQNETPGAAIFVSKQAPAMMSLLVNPDQLEAFRLVAAPPAERRQARAEFDQLKQNLLATTGLDYKQDIQPWLGKELTLAVTTLDIDRDTANGKQPGYLLAIATQDAQRSREFLQLFWQKQATAGADLTFEQYKGVKLIYTNPSAAIALQPSAAGGFYKAQPATRRRQDDPALSSLTNSKTRGNSLASAAVGDQFVLFANHPKVLRDAINNVQVPDLNLSSANAYTQSLQTLTQPRIGLSFINLPSLANFLGEDAISLEKIDDQTGNSKPATTAELQPDFKALAIGLGLKPQGILAETAILTAGESTNTASLSQPVDALKYIPLGSPISASGSDLHRLWTQLSQGLSTYKTISQLVNQPLAALQSRWQIDLPNDVFNWVNDEYALAALPTATVEENPTTARKGKAANSTSNQLQTAALNNFPALKNDWIFAAKRSNPEAAQAIAHLDDVAKQQGLSVGSLKLGEHTVSAWTQLTTASNPQKLPLNLQAEVRGVHAKVADYELFTTSIVAMDAALKATENSLLTGNQFKQAIAALNQPNNGYLYLDWLTSQPLLERQFPLLKVVELAAKPLFSHLRSLTISSYGSESGIQRGGVFIQLNG